MAPLLGQCSGWHGCEKGTDASVEKPHIGQNDTPNSDWQRMKYPAYAAECCNPQFPSYVLDADS